MTFTLPITNLVLPFADIDARNDGVTRESIELVSPGYTVLYQGTGLTPTGNTFEAVTDNIAHANSLTAMGGEQPSESGSLTVMYPGPLTSVSRNHCMSLGGSTSLSADLFPVSWIPC